MTRVRLAATSGVWTADNLAAFAARPTGRASVGGTGLC